MKNLFRKSTFLVLLLIVSITMTGCDMAKIGDVIGKIADIVVKIGNGLKTFGQKLGQGGNNAAPQAPAAPGTASNTPNVTASGTAAAPGVASDTAKPGTATGTAKVEKPKKDSKAAALQIAIEKYNADHIEMINALNSNTIDSLIKGGYLDGKRSDYEGLRSDGSLTENGKIVAVDGTPNDVSAKDQCRFRRIRIRASFLAKKELQPALTCAEYLAGQGIKCPSGGTFTGDSSNRGVFSCSIHGGSATDYEATAVGLKNDPATGGDK